MDGQPFFNTLLQRRDAGSLDVTVYRKPMHTGRYLDFHSHYSPQVNRARTITTGQSNVQKEEHHLARVLRQNEYLSAFIHSSSKPPRRDEVANVTLLREEGHRLAMLTYTEGAGEDARWVCRKFGMKLSSDLHTPSTPCCSK